MDSIKDIPNNVPKDKRFCIFCGKTFTPKEYAFHLRVCRDRFYHRRRIMMNKAAKKNV